MAKATCERCGFEWEAQNFKKNPTLCSSCRAVKVKTVHTIHGKCVPHQGEFAKDDVTPLDDNGNPVHPGGRTCGFSDCIHPKHWIRD